MNKEKEKEILNEIIKIKKEYNNLGMSVEDVRDDILAVKLRRILKIINFKDVYGKNFKIKNPE